MDAALVAPVLLAQPLVFLLDRARDHLTVVAVITLAALALLVLIVATLVLRVVRLTERLEAEDAEADREGGRASAQETGAHPLTNFSRFGRASDPLNIKIIAHADQLVTAFNAAGWYRADKVRLLSSLHLSIAAVFHLMYAEAPVSALYLYGRKQDFAFQKPGRNVRERDHVRFWDTGERAQGGRPIWVGAATRDIAVELSPRTRLITHRIAPEVDAERSTIIHDLTSTGWVIAQKWEPGFGRPVELVTAMGYPFYTDGRVVALTLADVPVFLPLTTTLRGPGASALSRRIAGAFRWMLPRIGRRLAKEQQDEDKEAVAAMRRRPPAEA
jgi:LssY C-terminus